MKISFNCTDDQQVVHTHKDAGLSDQVPCSKPDISPEAYLNDYRNRMPFHYIEEGSDGYYYWQYGSIMDLVINFVDEIAQSEDMPEAVLDVRIDDKSVVDPVTGVAHLGSMAVRNTADYYTLQQTDKIVGGLSQQIKDLQEGAVASIVDSSENLMSGQLLMWDSEARRLVGSPLVKGDAEKSIILKTSSSDPNFASHEGALLLGKGLRSSFPYQFVTGYYNKLIPEQVFSVGTGFSDEARSTAFSISRGGKVKVFTPPVDKDDIVRKEELDSVKAIADKAVVANEPITPSTRTKITYDAKGLVTEGSDLAVSDIPELPTSKITSGVFSDDRIASANTWNAKQDALTEQQLSAVNSEITSEKVATYDGYAETINKKLDKSGGTITGSLVVSEHLIVNGTTSTVHTQNLKVTDKLIYVAKDNTTPLTSPAGLITPKYDGINNGGIVYDNTGTAYVGDISLDGDGNVDVNNSDLQPIATRDAAITDGNIVKWDDTNKTLVDSGKALSDLATKEDLQEVSNSNLLYNSDFGIHGSINGPTSEDTIPGWYSGGGYSYVKYDTTKKSVYIRQLYNASYGGPLLSQELSPYNAYSYPRDFIGGKTFTLSAEFEDINDAGEYELRLIFRPTGSSNTDVIHSTPIKNGKVSVTATAPEKSDFGMRAEVYATKGIGVAHRTLMFINYMKLEFGSQATPYLPPLRQEEVWKNTKLLTYREMGYNYSFNSVSDDKVLSEEALNFYFAKIKDVNAKSFTKVYRYISDLNLQNGASVIDIIKKMVPGSLVKLSSANSNSTTYISGCPADNGILTIYKGYGTLNYLEITYQQFISDNNVSNIYTGYPVYSNNAITDIVWHLIENTANKTTTVGPDSTDDQYPTAKAVYDALPKIEIIDNLDSADTDKALSANQGRVLNEMMGGVEARVTNLENNTYVDLTTLSDNPSTMSTRATTYGLARSADITYSELQVGQSISRVKFDITKSAEEMDAWLNSLVFPADEYIIDLALDDAEGSIISVQIMDAAGTRALCFGGDGIAYVTNDIAEAGISHGWIIGQFEGFDALDENGVGLLLDQNNETPCQIGTINPDVSDWNGVFVTAGLNESAGSGSTENVMTQFTVGETISSISFNPNLTTEQIQQKIQEIQQAISSNSISIFEINFNGNSEPIIAAANFDNQGQEYIYFADKIIWSAIDADDIDGIAVKEGWQDNFSFDLEDPNADTITFAWDKSTLTFSFTTTFEVSRVADSFNGSVLGKEAIAAEGTELTNLVIPTIDRIPYQTFTMPLRDSNGSIITNNSERTLAYTIKLQIDSREEDYTGVLSYSDNIEGATGYTDGGVALLLNYYFDPDSGAVVSAPGTANFVFQDVVAPEVTFKLASIYKKSSTATEYATIESGTNIDSLQFDTGFDIETFLRAQDYSTSPLIELMDVTIDGEDSPFLGLFHDVNNTENPDLYELLIAETTVYSSQSGWQNLDENNAVHLPTLLSEYGLNVTSVYINSVYTVNGEEWNGTLVKARVGDSNSESGGGSTETGNSITQTDAGYEVNYTNGKVLLPFRFNGNLNAYIENNKINIDVIPTNNYDSLGNLPIVNANLREQYFYPETNRYYRHIGETGTKNAANALNAGDAINSIKFNTGYDIDNFVRSLPYENSTCNLLYVGADALATIETGIQVTKFKFYRDYDQLDSFLTGLDYSGLADGEPRMLVRVDNGNYEIAAFKMGSAYMLGYMESGSGIIVYSTAEIAEQGIVQGWQNLNDDNLINTPGNITDVYTNDTSWIGNIVDAMSYQNVPLLVAIHNSSDDSYSFGSVLEDRIWDTTNGWQSLDENGVYNFSEKLQAVLGVTELPITEIADHNGWNGNLAMKNEPVSTDSTVFINGVIYFYDGSSYKAVNGESDRQEILDVSHGGTGVASFNNNNSLILTGDSPTSNLTTLPSGPEGYILQSNGPEAIPSWIPSTEISSKSVYVLDVSGEGSVTALQARNAIDAFNSGKSVICRMTGFLTATLTSVTLPETSSTGNTVMTFLVDVGETILKFTLELPSDAADSDELVFNQTEFGGNAMTIATADDIATIIL